MDFETFELGYCLLYKVVINGTATNWYTSRKEAFEYDGDTYTPASIEKSSYAKEGGGEPSEITLKMPVNSHFISRISSFAPVVAMVYVYIVSTEEESPTPTLLFRGEVTEIKVSADYIAEVTLAEDLLPKKLPALFIQPACNHSLFSDGCTLDKDDFAEEIEISSLVSPINLASDDLLLFDNNYFMRGMAIYSGEVRYITASDTLTIEINLPFESDVEGETITIYPGCDKQANTCRTKFDNFNNFLGFVKVPKKNPIFSNI